MTRDFNLDILRIFSILAVVMIHIIAPYSINSTFKINQFDSWLVEIVNNSLFWCVPVFL